MEIITRTREPMTLNKKITKQIEDKLKEKRHHNES